MAKPFFRTFILLVFPLLSFCQTGQTDSLLKLLQAHNTEDTFRVNLLNQLSRKLMYENKRQALSYAEAGLQLSEKIGFKYGQAQALLNRANININQTNNDASVKDAMQAIIIFKELNNIERLAASYQSLAGAYISNEAMPEGIDATYNALEYYEKLGQKIEQGVCYATIGFNYYYQESFDQSFDAFYKSVELLKGKDAEENWATPHANIYLARLYLRKKDFLKAEYYNSIGLNVGLKTNYFQAIANGYFTKGEILVKRSEDIDRTKDDRAYKTSIENALNNYLIAIKNAWLAKDTGGLCDGLVRIAEANLKIRRLDQARIYADSALFLGKIIGSKDVMMNGYRVESKIDSAAGDYKMAYQNASLHSLYRDSLLNEENTKKSLQAKLQYDYNKVAEKTREEQILKDSEARRIRNLQYFFIILFVLIAIFLLWNNRQKQKAKNNIEKAYAELKSTQQQLIQSEKMASLGELTAGIAHEIQNPLNFVNNFSEVSRELINELKVEKGKLKVEEQEEILNDIDANLEKINHHGKRADAIVKGMLQHSRKSEGTKEPTDINKLCEEYLRLSYHGLRAKDKEFNATLETNFDASIGKMNIVSSDIGRVLLNLLSNAFYAVQEKHKQNITGFNPKVSITTKAVKSPSGDLGALISISDNGGGIPPGIVDKIFQPFFTTKPTGQGTGLGLSLAYDIVKAHGGELKVETKEGVGTMFSIVLPIV